MEEDWLAAAVDGLSLENGLDTSGGGGGESPSLTNNITQLLKSTRRDRADLEARLTQLRGFIQQTDEVMRGIVESGDPTLAAKYTHLATTRRSLEQNAGHLHQLLQKVTESEARARQLAERGRQLETEEASEVTSGGGAVSLDWPEQEQKVAVVRGRPGPPTRKRDAAEQPDREEESAGAAGGVPVDRLLRALQAGDGRSPAAEAVLRDKAAELDATRQKLQQLRQLMAAVQEARASPARRPHEQTSAELRMLFGEEEAAEPAGQPGSSCDDCVSNGPGPRRRAAGMPPQMAPLTPRRAGLPDRQPAPTREASIASDDVLSQLQQVTAMVQSLTRQPWPQSAPVWPPYWGYSPPPPPPPPQTAAQLPPQVDAQHQQTLSALGQLFQLLQNQQQQIQHIRHQLAAAQQPPPPPAGFSQVSASLLRVDEPPNIELAGSFPPPTSAGASMLNNQVAPGSRANNYWDNFRSYSRQNLLSGGGEMEAERPRGDSESFDDARAEGFMARPRTKRQKVNKENQQLERSLSNSLSNTTRPGAAAASEPPRPRAHRASTPQNNPQVDAIYSCVTALIALNQEQPEFLIELLHDLQLVRSERQRQQVLLAVQSVVVQEVSGARHKQRNRGVSGTAAAAAVMSAATAGATPTAGHHTLLTAEREEVKTSSHHMFNKHTKNWSHLQQRPDPGSAMAGVTEPTADPEDTTVAKNLAPVKNAATKNTTKPMTFEPTSALPLDDPELQLARVLHEMNVFLSDHHAALLSPALLSRLERLLLRTCGQARAGGTPAGLNSVLEEAMVPYMGQPVSEAGGRLVQSVLERLGAVLRGGDLLSSPPPAAPPLAADSDSEAEEEAAAPTDSPRQLEAGDDGPQVIPEQEVPSLSGHELSAAYRAGAEPATAALTKDDTQTAELDT